MLTFNFEFIKKNKKRKETLFSGSFPFFEESFFPRLRRGKNTQGLLCGHHVPSVIMRRRYYYNIRNV